MPNGREHPIRRKTWWDSLPVGENLQSHHRLFGNANIGQRNFTNLNVAGTLTPGSPVFLAGWSITTDIDESNAKRFLANTIMTLVLGDKPQADLHGSTLLKEAQPLDVVIPIRQHLSVSIDFYERPTSLPEFRLWVNLEGWIIETYQ